VRGKPVVAISAGDPSGVGPEVLARALSRAAVRRALTPLVFGDASLARALPRFEVVRPGAFGQITQPTLVAVTALDKSQRWPGRPSRPGGRAQWRYLTAAIAAVRAGHAHALCTAPVSKEQIARAGIPFTGHTEVLGRAFGCEVLMMMQGPRLRVALATNHLPLTKVPGALSTPRLVRQLVLLSRSLAPGLGHKPRIAVCGLNPHAGDGGLLGREDRAIIAPAIARARRRGVRCEGPLAADGLFGHWREAGFDVALAMYHDQGLVPAKALDFARTVNISLGLPIPRTSPDHGVAYDIAGKRRADGRPMAEALLEAARAVRVSKAWLIR